MKIVQNIRAVEHLFRKLDKEIQSLRFQTKIQCPLNCYHCCTFSRIEATSLEFYPLAYYLFKTGQSYHILQKIELTNNDKICPVLQTMSPMIERTGCTYYEKRGLVCRLFGYYYASDKYESRKLITCKIIKSDQAEKVELANKILVTKPLGPSNINYYSQLQLIDYYEAQRLYPIGQAIKIALDTIVTHFRYNGQKAI